MEELAREAGIDLEVLELLKRLGLTGIDELKSRLQVEEDDDTPEPRSDQRSTGAGGRSAEPGRIWKWLGDSSMA